MKEEPARPEIPPTTLWLALLGRGLAALLFAMLAISNPRMPISTLAKLFAAFAVVDGALALYGASRARRAGIAGHGRPLAIEGFTSGALGVAALLFPPASALRILGGVRSVITGALDVLWARRDPTTELPQLGGIVGVGLGAVILGWPGGELAVPWLLGLAAFVSGALFTAGALSKFRRDDLAVSTLPVAA